MSSIKVNTKIDQTTIICEKLEYKGQKMVNSNLKTTISSIKPIELSLSNKDLTKNKQKNPDLLLFSISYFAHLIIILLSSCKDILQT